jgi:hypothetical protein
MFLIESSTRGPSISNKDRREYHRQKEAERRAQSSVLDQEMLELMRWLRNYPDCA